MNQWLGKSKSTLDTPCLVIDKKQLLVNIRDMQHQVAAMKKNLRPHVKTHKCTAIAKLQIEAGAIGIAAAKVSEALVLAEHHFKNTLITSPVVTTTKINALMQCLTLDPKLTVVIDHLENAAAIHHAAKAQNQSINILIDIDPNVGRTGIAFADAVEFANALQQFSHLKLQGIQCYAGNLQHILNANERRAASTTIMQKAAQALKTLQAAGFSCDILSGSGTGTYDIDMQIPEVTEVQPGSYTVMDAEYQPIKKFQPALTLLTSIISVNHRTHVTCDAGWKALYEVPTRPIVRHPAGFDYQWSGDEHGKIIPQASQTLPKLGDIAEIMVAHCDPTINLFDVFYVTENDTIVDVWPINMRGKSQ